MRKLRVIYALIPQLVLFSVNGTHVVTDAQHSLLSNVRGGHFIAGPEHTELVKWADASNLYQEYGFEDIEHISPVDAEAIAKEIGSILHDSLKAQQFLKELSESGLDRATRNKLLILAYINLSGSTNN